MGNKKSVQVTAATALNTSVGALGACAMVASGPIGWLVGGALVSAGISG